MNVHESITYVQAAFTIVGLVLTLASVPGIVPILQGLRVSQLRSDDLPWIASERVALPLLWAAVGAWTVSAVLAFTASIIWFSAVGIVMAILSLALSVFVWCAASRLQRMVNSAAAEADV